MHPAAAVVGRSIGVICVPVPLRRGVGSGKMTYA
jgi:hypothetical protein